MLFFLFFQTAISGKMFSAFWIYQKPKSPGFLFPKMQLNVFQKFCYWHFFFQRIYIIVQHFNRQKWKSYFGKFNKTNTFMMTLNFMFLRLWCFLYLIKTLYWDIFDETSKVPIKEASRNSLYYCCCLMFQYIRVFIF